MKNLKRIKIVLIILVLFISSCTPKEVECDCKVEYIHYESIRTEYYNSDTDRLEVEKSYLKIYEYTDSDITDCSRDGEVLNAGIEGVSEVHYILRCQ